MVDISACFPTQRRIWEGAVLGSIAHAVATARYPMFSHEQSWDGTNYSVQDSTGSRGTITFAGRILVAVFFSNDSPRNPFTSNVEYDLERYFGGATEAIRSVAATEALPYVLQEYRGESKPVITAAFWGDGESELCAAAEPWAQVFEQGAHLIENQLMDDQESLARWRDEFELDEDEIGLIASLAGRRIQDANTPIQLTAEEASILARHAEGEAGMRECRESLAELNMIVE